MTKELDTTSNITKLYKAISSILNTARANAYKAVNFAMVTSYWSIGQLIVEDEQNGNERAEYGKAVLEGLSKKLTAEFGKGFKLLDSFVSQRHSENGDFQMIILEHIPVEYIKDLENVHVVEEFINGNTLIPHSEYEKSI